jgi:predicted nuclease of restriction endonuclease-like RecB superfamily
MLPENLIKPFLRFDGQALSVDHLDETDPFWVRTAEELIALHRESVGRSQTAWERRLERYLGSRLDYLRVRGLARVLAPPSAFAQIQTPCPPVELRRKLLPHGPVFSEPDLFHPHTRHDLLQEVGAGVGMDPEQVDAAMFADRPEEQVLKPGGPAWSPSQLLARYNLELARGALYRATGLQIEIYDNYKEVFRYLKLFRVMYFANELPGGGYRVSLSGPLSDFIETDRYGFSFAEFMPALLLGERWSMVAKTKDYSEKRRRQRRKGDAGSDTEAEPASRRYYYRLDHTCGLRSHYRRGPEYDSSLERTFAEEFTEFEQKFGEERGHWRLKRESQVLVLESGAVMLPDFVLQSTLDDQRKILIEIVGFWEPGYLKRKLEKARALNSPLLLFLVYEDLKVSQQDFDGLESGVLFFKHRPLLKDILPVVEQMADRLYGPLPTHRRQGQAGEPPPSLNQLVQAYHERAEPGQQDWLLLPQVEKVLKQLDSSFTSRRYGFGSLSALVQENSALFATRRRATKGRPIEVRLLGDAMSEQAIPAGTHSLPMIQADAPLP